MKSLSKLDGWLQDHESGQAAAVVALLLFFVFLPLAALAIDGSMVYLVRRDLQNVADASALAACTVLSQNGDSTTAQTAAQSTINNNLGAGASTQFASPNSGSGVSLIRGIEISASDVRVALQRPAPTVLTQFVGRGQTMVTAQAHCSSTAGGGLMPIAVQRYDYGNTWVDYVAQQGAPIYPTDSVTQSWPSPYPPGTFDLPVPLSQYQASPSEPGPQVSLIGQSSSTNNLPNDMNGSVLLDIRNIDSSTSVQYFNGADGQANSNKSMSEYWILQHGYAGPLPSVGKQVAQLSGVGASFGPQAMANAGYHVGDIVAAIVYDGDVWSTPDFQITLTPQCCNGVVSGYPNNYGNAVQYTVKITKPSGASLPWVTALNFDLDFVLTNSPVPTGTLMQVVDEAGTHDVTSSSYTAMGVTSSAGWQGTLYIYTPSAGQMITQTQSYLSGLNLLAQSSTGRQRGAQSYYGFGITTPDFAVSSDGGSLNVQQGTKLNLHLWALGVPSSFSKCNDANVQANVVLPGGAVQPWNSFFASDGQTSNITIKNSPQSAALAFDANANATTGNFILQLTVGPCNGDTHSVQLPLEIDPGGGSGTSLNYVYIQGYALFQITQMKSNDVLVQCISPLLQSLDSVTAGLRPRLVPWN